MEWTQKQELVLEGRVCRRDDDLAADEWGRGDGRGEGGEFVVADVEAGPVYGGGWGGEGRVGVPEERGDV